MPHWLIIGAIAAAAGIAAALCGWLWWELPRRRGTRLAGVDDKAKADVENDFRTTIGQLIGGVAVILAAGLAYLQFTQQLSEQHQASSDLLISNQVTKGFELLGKKEKKDTVQRIGGIYVLEGVMNTSEKYQQPVLEALSAFVRDETKAKTGDEPPAADIQAALTVIGRRTGGPSAHTGEACTELLEKTGKAGPDLGGAQIPRAKLLGKANEVANEVSGANEESKANLACARLEDVNLNGATLNANLTGAWLRNAKLAAAVLPYANLTGAWLMKAQASGANLSHANLTGADLTDADKTAAADLTGANLSGAVLTDADLSHADLRGADLRGARYSVKTKFPRDFNREAAGMISD